MLLDAPGGTQCPQSVLDAITRYLRESNANLGGAFAASRRSDELVEGAHAIAAKFLGCRAEEMIFGQNMTTLNFALTRALGRTLDTGRHPADQPCLAGRIAIPQGCYSAPSANVQERRAA